MANLQLAIELIRTVDPSVRLDGLSPDQVIQEALSVGLFVAGRQEQEARSDAVKVVNYQGLKIGITHRPGDRRFPEAKPMRAYYGNIHRSWGKGEDGKSIDVYLHPEFDPERSGEIYRIAQRTPLGELDEFKYGIGYSDPQQFVDDFIWHAGGDRFAYVQRVNSVDLDNYRADAAYHADSCCCEACSEGKACEGEPKVKPRRRRKRQANTEEESVRVDLSDPLPHVDAEDEEKDLADIILEEKQEEFDKVFQDWIKAGGRYVRSADSLEVLQEELRSNPGKLFSKLNGDRFAELLAETMILSDLGGRLEVLEEDGRSDSLREDAQRPEWLRLPFVEAIEFFRKRITMPDNAYRKLDANYHQWAFSVANITNAEQVQDIRFLVDQALSEGSSLEVFQKQWSRLIGRKYGWEPGERRQRIILETNLRSAYSEGRAQQMYDPDVLSRRPLFVWRWRDSPHPREHHKALHNKAIPADHKFWESVSFPADWNCRCSCLSMSESGAKSRGIEVLKNPPKPEDIAGPEFRHPLRGMSDKERAAAIESMKQNLSPDLRKLVDDAQP